MLKINLPKLAINQLLTTLAICLLLSPTNTFSQDKSYWWTGGNDESQGVFSNKFGTNIDKDLIFITNSNQRWVLKSDGRFLQNGSSSLFDMGFWGSDSVYTNYFAGPFAPGNNYGFVIGMKNRIAELKQLDNYPMTFYTNNTERLRISSSGYIGIGTNTPSALLDVNGTLRFRNGAANGLVLKSDAQGNATWQTLNDDNATNEIQSLGLTNNILSLSQDATTVDLSMYLDNTDTQLTEAEVDAFVDNNGYLLIEADGDVSNELITSAILNGNNLEITDAGGTQTIDLSSLDNSSMSLDDADADPYNEIQSLSLTDKVE